MFFLSDSDSSDDEIKKSLIIERKLVRQNSCIFNLSDEKFESYFRLNKPSFKHVLEAIEPHLRKGTRSTFIPNTTKLAATLQFLARGSYQLSVGKDFNLGLSQPVVSKILSEILDVMEREVCPQWIKFDMTAAEKNEAKLYIFEKTKFPGVIGCVAGTHIRILAPNKEDQNLYLNRNGYYSLNAMIICDHKLRIRFVDARYPGSSPDSVIWNESKAKQTLQTRYEANDRDSWLLGNAAYPLEPYLMTPYRSACEGSAEAVFNLKHARARNSLERTISVLKSRFRCLLGERQLHYKPTKAIKIVNVCAALHNICIKYGLDIPNEEAANCLEDILEYDSPESMPSTEAYQKREEIKNSFL